MTQERSCRDCRFADWTNVKFPECHAAQNERKDESGILARRAVGLSDETEKSWRWTYCETQRRYGWFDAMLTKVCGRDGRWFEPKGKT